MTMIRVDGILSTCLSHELLGCLSEQRFYFVTLCGLHCQIVTKEQERQVVIVSTSMSIQIHVQPKEWLDQSGTMKNADVRRSKKCKKSVIHKIIKDFPIRQKAT